MRVALRRALLVVAEHFVDDVQAVVGGGADAGAGVPQVVQADLAAASLRGDKAPDLLDASQMGRFPVGARADARGAVDSRQGGDQLQRPRQPVGFWLDGA